jgi:DNA-binding MarR family transcriptional regulator
MREVASFLCITPPSATVLIDNLIKSGLVIREQDPEDRRAIHLLLTNRGKIFIQKSNRRQSDLAKKMMRCLSPLERQTIYHLHTKLQNLLKV